MMFVAEILASLPHTYNIRTTGEKSRPVGLEKSGWPDGLNANLGDDMYSHMFDTTIREVQVLSAEREGSTYVPTRK
jgi:hypothetical protein